MAYYMRFLSEDDQLLNLDEIMSGLRSADPGFRLDEDGILAKGEELLAELEVSRPGDDLFTAEIDELRELAGQDSAAGQAVATRLELVTAILAVRVLWQERTAEQTLDLLDPPVALAGSPQPRPGPGRRRGLLRSPAPDPRDRIIASRAIGGVRRRPVRHALRAETAAGGHSYRGSQHPTGISGAPFLLLVVGMKRWSCVGAWIADQGRG